MKILIASHGKFAKGLRSAVEIITGDKDIDVINAYIEGVDFKKELDDYLKENDEVCILTDLFGGSVNQQAMQYIKEKNIHIITGVNLSLALEISITNKNGLLTKEMIREIVSTAQQQIIYVNDAITSFDKDDFD